MNSIRGKKERMLTLKPRLALKRTVSSFLLKVARFVLLEGPERTSIISLTFSTVGIFSLQISFLHLSVS